MNVIIELLLKAKWWMHVILGVALIGVGIYAKDFGAQAAADLETALATPAPEAVDLGVYERAQYERPFNEINVRARLATDYNTNLIERRNGIKTDETAMYVLFDPAAPESETLVRAVVMVEPDDVERFIDQLLSAPSFGFDFDFHGTFSTYHGQGSHAKEVLRDKYGLTPATGLLFIEPFLDGREAALTAISEGRQNAESVFYYLAAAFFLFAAIRFAFERFVNGPRPNKARVAAMAPVTGHPMKPLPAQVTPITQTASRAGPKATRAAALEEKRLAEIAAQPAPAQPQTALEKARAFKASVTPAAQPDFKAKLKQDPFAKLAV